MTASRCLLALLLAPSLLAGEVSLKLTADDAVAVDLFGSAVALTSTRLLIGAPLDDHDLQGNAGSAYLFDRATREQLARLDSGPFSNGDNFGAAVALDGDLALVGAPFEIERGNPGAAYLFDAVTGAASHVLLGDDSAAGDRFGASVDLSGARAVVGAPRADHAGSASGAAYVFDTTSGVQLHRLLADDAAPGDWFGSSVAISGDLVVVGARLADDARGAVYVFDAITGAQLRRITAGDGQDGDSFGISVDLHGTTAVVGAYLAGQSGPDSGSAYLYDVVSGALLHELVPDDSAGGDWMGVSVALDGAAAVVGAHRKDGAFTEGGAVYVFDLATGAQLHRLDSVDTGHFDRFGSAVAVAGADVLGGATGVEPIVGGGDQAGAAYLFDLDDPGPWLDHGHALAGVAGEPSLVPGGSLAGGTPISLTLTGAAPLATTWMVLGLGYAGVNLRGGVLVPSPDLLRGNLATDGAGTLALATTWSAGVPADFTFFVQFWVVDAAGPVGYAASNALSGTTP